MTRIVAQQWESVPLLEHLVKSGKEDYCWNCAE